MKKSMLALNKERLTGSDLDDTMDGAIAPNIMIATLIGIGLRLGDTFAPLSESGGPGEPGGDPDGPWGDQ